MTYVDLWDGVDLVYEANEGVVRAKSTYYLPTVDWLRQSDCTTASLLP